MAQLLPQLVILLLQLHVFLKKLLLLLENLGVSQFGNLIIFSEPVSQFGGHVAIADTFGCHQSTIHIFDEVDFVEMFGGVT